MTACRVHFSVASHAAWAPGIETDAAWRAWADSGVITGAAGEPGVRAMPAMLRRRAGFLGKMALEVAYQCMGERRAVPTLFCSRHGEVSRSIDLITDLARDEPLSPTGFGMSVHNAIGGLFSIARKDQANNSALAAGSSGIEHAVIEACGLLADGEEHVLLVAYDCPLPALYQDFDEANAQPYAWAWLLQAPAADGLTLNWSAAAPAATAAVAAPTGVPPGLDVLRFYLRGDSDLVRESDGRRWQWGRHV